MRIDANSLIVKFTAHSADTMVSNQQMESTESTDNAEQTNICTPPATSESEDNNNEKGVLRLLEEGHFRGVADVRLRINFHDEISALEQDQMVQIAQEKVPELAESIRTGLDGFLQLPGLDEQWPDTVGKLSGEFSTNISNVLNNFISAKSPDRSEIISQLQSSFNNLKSGLESALDETTAPAIEEPTDKAVSNDTENIADGNMTAADDGVQPAVDTTQTLFDQLLAQLVDTFTSGLKEFEDSLDQNAVFPEISSPHGNGRAFDKFLNAYNELNGDTQSKIEPPTINTIT